MDHLERLREMRPQPSGPPMSIADRVLWTEWGFVEKDAHLFDYWASWLNPEFKGILTGLLDKPDPLELDAIRERRALVYDTFCGLLDVVGPSRFDVYRRLGSPSLLAFYAGVTDEQMSADDWNMAVYRTILGYPTSSASDGRSRLVYEPATGRSWPSVKALAAELGCAEISAYKHMGGSLKTLKGRVFSYSNKE